MTGIIRFGYVCFTFEIVTEIKINDYLEFFEFRYCVEFYRRLRRGKLVFRRPQHYNERSVQVSITTPICMEMKLPRPETNGYVRTLRGFRTPGTAIYRHHLYWTKWSRQQNNIWSLRYKSKNKYSLQAVKKHLAEIKKEYDTRIFYEIPKRSLNVLRKNREKTEWEREHWGTRTAEKRRSRTNFTRSIVAQVEYCILVHISWRTYYLNY